jgi:hypothetical protein
MRKELESEMKVSTVLVIRCVQSGSLSLGKSTRKNRNKFNEQDQVFRWHVLEFQGGRQVTLKKNSKHETSQFVERIF